MPREDTMNVNGRIGPGVWVEKSKEKARPGTPKGEARRGRGSHSGGASRVKPWDRRARQCGE